MVVKMKHDEVNVADLPKCPECGNKPEFKLRNRTGGMGSGEIRCPYGHLRDGVAFHPGSEKAARLQLAEKWVEIVGVVLDRDTKRIGTRPQPTDEKRLEWLLIAPGQPGREETLAIIRRLLAAEKRVIELEAAQSRIAELEARTLTVKMPPYSFFDFKLGSQFTSGAYVNIEAMNKELAKAGITLQIEGD